MDTTKSVGTKSQLKWEKPCVKALAGLGAEGSGSYCSSGSSADTSCNSGFKVKGSCGTGTHPASGHCNKTGTYP
jgi:hypothetical protein